MPNDTSSTARNEDTFQTESDGGINTLVIAELSSDDMIRLQEEAEALEQERQAILSTLAGEIEAKFTKRSSRRQAKEREWIEAIRLYLGPMASNRGSQIKTRPLESDASSNRPTINLVKTKCDVAIAQGLSLQFSGGDKNWDIHPSAVVEGVNDESATLQAERMEAEIEDQLAAARYGAKSRRAYTDRVILGTGILKGPVPSMEAKLTYEQVADQDGSVVLVPVYKAETKPCLYRIDPWMAFPDDTVNEIEDVTDFIELHPMSKLQLYKLKKNPGFISEALDELCKLDPLSYANQVFSEYASLTDAGENIFKDKYSVKEYHGPITVDQLGALGITPSMENDSEMYFGEVWVCQGIVIRAELEAITGLCEIPYLMCPWISDPGSVFGFGLPIAIKDPQRAATACWDMILENSSLSSGPIGLINKSLIEPFDSNWELGPNKLFGTTDYAVSDIRQTMTFLTIPNVTGDLFNVFNMTRELGQEESGVPLLAGAGMQSPITTSDGATGLARQEQQSTTVSDLYAELWDDYITSKLLNRWYHWNMQFNPKPDIVGDFEVDVRSSSEFRRNQLSMRELEKLSVESAQNPLVAQVIEPLELQRARLSMMRLPSKRIIKSDQKLKQEQEEAAQNPPPPDPAVMKIQVEQEGLELEKQKLQLEMRKQMFEETKAQAREQMDFQERMMATQARFEEAKARVFEAELNRQMEMAKLAQKSETDRASIMADLEKSSLQSQTNQFIAGMDTRVRLGQQKLAQDEARYARENGKGY